MSRHRHHPFLRFGGPWAAPGAGHARSGPRPPFGGPPFGRGFGPGGRKFGRGDLKYVILDLLQEGARHGYDIIRALEERFHGFYSPSPGSVYPTLQLLEDQGFVSGTEREGKKVYNITDSGRAFLKEQAETLEGIRARMAEGWGKAMTPELRDLMHEVQGLGQLLFREGARGAFGDPDTVRRLREVVARARRDVEAVFDRAGSGEDFTA